MPYLSLVSQELMTTVGGAQDSGLDMIANPRILFISMTIFCLCRVCNIQKHAISTHICIVLCIRKWR